MKVAVVAVRSSCRWYSHIDWVLLREFLLCRLVTCLFVSKHIFSQIRSMYAGIDEPVFMAATNADRSDCVHMLIGALQR